MNETSMNFGMPNYQKSMNKIHREFHSANELTKFCTNEMQYTDIIRNRDFTPEWKISASKSSGAGGQHVNKVNTKIDLRFSLADSSVLSEDEKTRLINRLSGKLTKNGELIITAESERSQKRNKELAIEKFFCLLEQNLKTTKKRIPAKPSRVKRKKRLEEKRKHSEKKSRRRGDDL